MAKLIQTVQDLVDSGKLHQFDAEWICNLAPDQQMAAAEKCMNGNLEAPVAHVALIKKFDVRKCTGRKPFRNRGER